MASGTAGVITLSSEEGTFGIIVVGPVGLAARGGKHGGIPLRHISRIAPVAFIATVSGNHDNGAVLVAGRALLCCAVGMATACIISMVIC